MSETLAYQSIRPEVAGLADWRENLDPDTGLWSKVGDETGGPVADPSVTFETRRQPDFLLAAAEAGILSAFPYVRTLESVAALQWASGADAGNYLWWSADPYPKDGNAAFFTTLPMLVLRKEHEEALGREACDVIDMMLRAGGEYLARKARNRNFGYVNAYIGDLVCVYLSSSHLGEPMEEWEDLLREAGAYYKDQAWGWGEHLSDLYAKISQDAISVLLFLADTLPEDVQRIWESLLRELNAIDLLYEGGPRVPLNRTYAFEGPPPPEEQLPYAEMLRPIRQFPLNEFHGGLRAWLFRRGWHGEFAEEPPAKHPVQALGGNQALVHLRNGWRMGVMARYPVVYGRDNQREYGFAWQSMPFVLWSKEGDWGYLQWVVQDPGGRTAHPAISRKDPVKSLGTAPPFGCGESFGHVIAGGFAIRRRIKDVPVMWRELRDRLVVFPGIDSVWEAGPEPNQFRLKLSDPAKTVLYIQYVPLSHPGEILHLITGEGWQGPEFQVPLSKRRKSYEAIWIIRDHPGQISEDGVRHLPAQALDEPWGSKTQNAPNFIATP